MTASTLFLRRAELIVGPKVTTTNGPIEPVDARVFRTRIKFHIKADETSNANKAKISIYNLSEDSKTFLEQDKLVAFLNVGYGSVSNIFFGDVSRIKESRSGPDIITTVEAGDAEKILSSAIVSVSFKENATNRQIIGSAISQLNVSSGFLETIPEIKEQNGFSYFGTAKKLLDEQFKKVNLKWSIQGGQLQILKPNGTDEQTAVVLSQETGLIGIPTKTKEVVEFQSLLNPDLRVGRAVVLNSRRFLDGSGQTIKVTKSDFVGDSSFGPWFTRCEGVIV